MHNVGIMQGRLSPPLEGKIQAFPIHVWRDEFAASRELGLGCIEWIYERENLELNPLRWPDGASEIKGLSKRFDVRVSSVVADYFMHTRLFGPNEAEVAEAVTALDHLVEQCASTGIPIIEIPFVDNSALESDTDIEQALANISGALQRAAELGLKISLETSLPPARFAKMLEAANAPNLGVNYDMGNSASLGYDSIEEIALLGPQIMNVHIKDRLLGGTTVPLGAGNTDFAAVFGALRDIGYDGDFILQTARRDLENDISAPSPAETIIGYLSFLRNYLY